MNLVSLRPILAPLFGAVICFAVSPRPGAAVRDPTVAQFVARAVSVSDATDAGPIEILIRQWSSDEDLQNLRAALVENGPGKLLPVFRQARPEAGVVLLPGLGGGLGARARQRRTLPFQFAREFKTPAGRQVVVATDRHLGFGETPATRRAADATDQQPGSGYSTGVAPSPEPEFTLLDIRFGADGNGVGKTATAAKVAYNPAKKIFEIENFTAQPVRLSAVKSATP